MRQIILDTETTGLSPRDGNRILEIGCVEIVNRQLTGRNLHLYINPERESEEGALRVHGITTAFLSDKPKFAHIAEEFLAFVKGAEVIIHNAPFDVGFLDMELSLLGLPRFTTHVAKVTDTLAMAKEIFPGKRNSLDVLCDRFEVSNAHRTLHGALLDSELLAEVYLAMTRGQNTFAIGMGSNESSAEEEASLPPLAPVIVLRAGAEDVALHQQVLADVDKSSKGNCVWLKLPSDPADAVAMASAAAVATDVVEEVVLAPSEEEEIITDEPVEMQAPLTEVIEEPIDELVEALLEPVNEEEPVPEQHGLF